jgi:hypothetical protein
MKTENFYKLTEDYLNHLYPNHLYSGLYELNERDFPILDSTPRKISRLQKGIMSLVGGLLLAGTILFGGCSQTTVPKIPPPATDNCTTSATDNQTTGLTLDKAYSEMEDMFRVGRHYTLERSDNVTDVDIPSALYHNPFALSDKDVKNNKDALNKKVPQIIYATPGREFVTVTDDCNDKTLFILYKSPEDKIPDNPGSILIPNDTLLPNNSMLGSYNKVVQIPLSTANKLKEDVIIAMQEENGPRMVIPRIVNPYLQPLSDNETIAQIQLTKCGGGKTYEFEAFGPEGCNCTGYIIEVKQLLSDNTTKLLGRGNNPYIFNFNPYALPEGKSDIRIEAKDPEETDLISDFYMTVTVTRCGSGQGDHGGSNGGCSSGGGISGG